MQLVSLDLRAIQHLPCGCVADLASLKKEGEEELVVCPWCEATCCVIDFAYWQMRILPPMISPRAILVKHGDRVLDLVGRAACGHAMVRERAIGATAEHCDDELDLLRD